MVCARQPDKDCAMAERFTRSFYYSESDSCIKTKEDLGKMGTRPLPPMYAVPRQGEAWVPGGLSIAPYMIRGAAKFRTIMLYRVCGGGQKPPPTGLRVRPSSAAISTWLRNPGRPPGVPAGIPPEARDTFGQADRPPFNPPPPMAGARLDCKERIQICRLPSGQVLPFHASEAGSSVQHE